MAADDMEVPLVKKPFPIVGIGASAGGLDAMRNFLKAVPPDSGMAYIILQHLPRDFESNLTTILQRDTVLSVVEAIDNIMLIPDQVYVVPSNRVLTVADGMLQLNPRLESDELPHSIDSFFSSLAEVYQGYSIGIILSGLGSDGTLGLKKIKDHGGISFAQTPESAGFGSMPGHAINSGYVDFVLDPSNMPAQLAKVNKTLKNLPDDENTSMVMLEEENFRQILNLLHVRRGVDFTHYKQTTIRRRILRRMVINKNETTGDYLEFLRHNKSEQDTLYYDLLIPVTSFFRDAVVFDHLCENLFPTLLNEKSLTNPLRIWIAGVSTGEEAYSMAMCLSEFLGEKSSSVKVQIFATDLSEKNIEKARRALYNRKELANVSEARISKFFYKTDGNYHIKKQIRDMCVFAAHNFLKDPPFARIDLVCCRNVLIYMETYLQNKALNIFHYSLKQKGFLLLGKSETAGNASELFTSYKQIDKLYISKRSLARNFTTDGDRRDIRTKAESISRGEKRKIDYQRSADELLLAKFSPAGVIVDEQFDIVQFRGSTGHFLEASPGKASFNVLKMAREGLAFEIRNALHKAKASGSAVVKDDISINEGEQIVSIEVIPLPDTIEIHYLILFRNTSDSGKPRNSAGPISLDSNGDEYNRDKSRILHLEKEIAQVRDDMRSITEDQEAANEELQSANEELLSGSEELQSMNEELETSKEELQSANEELLTINQELYDRSEQFNQARLYTETILKTIHEPIVVLTHDLRIKSANESFCETFSCTENDTDGMILFELAEGRWDMPALRGPILQIQTAKLVFHEWDVDYLFLKGGPKTFRVHARMIESPTNEQLILLAFNDITLQRKEIESLKITTRSIKKDLQVMEDFFQHSPAGFCILKEPGHIFQFANPRYLEMYGKKEVMGKTFTEVFPGRQNEKQLRIFDKIYVSGESYSQSEVPFMLDGKPGEEEIVFMDLRYEVLKDESGNNTGILAFSYDVTEKVKRREQLENQSRLFESLLMQAPALICTLAGPKHTFELVNPQYQKLFGKRVIVGKTMGEAFPEIDPLPFNTLMDRVYETGEMYTGTEIPIFAQFDEGKPAYEKYFTFSYQPMYNEYGKINAVLAFGYEVTDQVKAKRLQQKNEAYLKEILETIPNMAFVADPAGNITFCNIHFVEFTGLTAEQANKSGMQSLYHPDMVEEVMELWKQSLTTGTPFEFVYLIRNKADGKFRWHLGRATALRDDKQLISGWVGTLTDIHEQILFSDELEAKVEERTELLQQANESLRHSNKNLEQFASVASHDLQEPLRKVRTFASILMQKHKDALPPAVQELVEKIETASARMAVLVKDVLSYSKLIKPESAFITVDLNVIVQNVLQDFDLTIREKNAVVNCSPLPVIEAISLQMNQLFYNLISNALKFQKDSENVVIDITSRKLEDEDIIKHTRLHPGLTYWEIICKDNGIGFDPEFSEQIFMIFQRLHDNSKYSGTGIGLALCRNIVVTHGGLIWAESSVLNGATFHILLPVKQSRH